MVYACETQSYSYVFAGVPESSLLGAAAIFHLLGPLPLPVMLFAFETPSGLPSDDDSPPAADYLLQK